MSSLPSLVRPRREPSVDVLVGAFESETQAVILRTTPRSEHTVLYVLVGMVALALFLISVTKLDRVVTGAGKIQPVAGTLYVQPLQSAIVRQIDVKVGDIVKKGQALATLDPTFAAADALQEEQKLASTKALVDRLQAELDQQPYNPPAGDPSVQLQKSIYIQDQSQYKSGLADFDARIRQYQSGMEQLRHDADNYRQRLDAASQVESSFETLQRDGWGSKLQTLQARDQRVEIQRLMADSESQIPQTQHMLDSVEAQRAVFVQQFMSNVSNNLATARDTLHDTQDAASKAERFKQLTALDAPMDAIVLKIGKASVGSVAAPPADQNSDPLFTLVPLDAPVEAEIDVPSQDIGFIAVGQNVEVKLDAYRFLQHGTAKGVIKTISEGTFTADDNNTPVPPYYKVLVTMTDVHLRDVPADFRLIPGMTLSGDIMVGKRTILSYLVEGALRTGSEAMREP